MVTVIQILFRNHEVEHNNTAHYPLLLITLHTEQMLHENLKLEVEQK